MLDRAIMVRKNKAKILKKIKNMGLNMLISQVKFSKHSFQNKVCFLKGIFYIREHYRI